MEHVLTGRAIVKLFRFEDGTAMAVPVVTRFPQQRALGRGIR